MGGITDSGAPSDGGDLSSILSGYGATAGQGVADALNAAAPGIGAAAITGALGALVPYLPFLFIGVVGVVLLARR